MNLIPRTAQKTLEKLASSYPALVITGPRQSGKTTLTQAIFPEKPYVSLEDLDMREYATDDPRGFLKQYENGAILDEVQNCPGLFSYLQTHLDTKKEMGLFILTGSQQFELISKVTQSLAGRTAKLSLLPFSLNELQAVKKAPKTMEELVFTGLYPPIYDRNLDVNIWYNNYVESYIERDVRKLINVRDLTTFQRFIRMCAARSGQILNLSNLANECAITHNSAKSWISILQASYIVHLLQPYYRNFNKRLIKTPKLYFYDPGLAAWLQNIQNPQHLATHPARGPLFETWVVSELLKYRYNAMLSSNLYFWRDNIGNEINVVVDKADKFIPIEIKSGQTFTPDFLKSLRKFLIIVGNGAQCPTVVYGGEKIQKREDVNILPWQKIHDLSDLVND